MNMVYPESSVGWVKGRVIPCPGWATRVETDDLDEVRRVQSAYGSVERRVVGRGRFGMCMSRVFVGDIGISWTIASLTQHASVATVAPLVHVPVAGPISYRFGRRTVEFSPGQALLIRPGTEYLVSYPGELPILTMVVPGLFTEPRYAGQARLADARGGFEVLGTPGSMARLAGIIGEIAAEPSMDAAGPRGLAYASRLSHWAARAFPVAERLRLDSRVAESRLAEVESWMDTHLTEPVRLEQLCALAGIEPTGLRKSFRRRRGVTPMQWLWSRRMAAARLRLLDASPNDTVIGIAQDCGLLHPGRFSVEYRERYGEKPSETLSRSLGR